MDNLNIIQQTFLKHGLEISPLQVLQFQKYYELLIEYNQKVNLTAITDFNEVVLKHFVDSVFHVKQFNPNAVLCDIGTGAGFPALPIKIMRPDLNIVLVDSLQKRIKFLDNVINELDLKDISTVHSRAQELKFKYPLNRSFDYVVSRAVAQLNILAELCIPYLKPGGEMWAYKAWDIDYELLRAKNSLSVLGGQIDSIKEYELLTEDLRNKFPQNPNFAQDIKRKIIVIKKASPTPTNYPRDKNKIDTNPL